VEVVFALLTLIGGLLVFDAAAVNFGTDSRDPIGDDHVR